MVGIDGFGWGPAMVSKKLRISAGIIIIAAVWLFFIYEAIVGEFLTNGIAIIILLCVGTYFGARLLGIPPRK